MSAHWIGARYYRKRDKRYVDRDDLDKGKNKSVHRVAKTARGPFTRLETRTLRTMPFRKKSLR